MVENQDKGQDAAYEQVKAGQRQNAITLQDVKSLYIFSVEYWRIQHFY